MWSLSGRPSSGQRQRRPEVPEGVVSKAESDDADLLTMVSRLEAQCGQLTEDATPEQLGELVETVYALIAGGLSRNYANFAELASIIEVMLEPVAAGDEPLTAEFRQILGDYIRALKRLAGSAPPMEHRPTRPPPPVEAEQDNRAQTVFLLEGDVALAGEIQQQAGHFGYAVRIIKDLESLMARLRAERPAAVVVDLALKDGGMTMEEAVERIRAVVGPEVPILALAEEGGLASRLRAARADVSAFFVKPVDMHQLVDGLDLVTRDEPERRFHVVIVEDSRTQAKYYSAILQRAGMECAIVSAPEDLLDTLAGQPVDLILMDMYMPGCNGVELAKVVRQLPIYESIPIVFLSGETEIDRQLDAMSLGADDFLTKPISPAHLIRSVAIRAERARNLRGFMITDNLTGLLNHTRIKEQLEVEVARASRSGQAVSFVMLDIDRFKVVNDTYGHQVGDRVIKTLARVLRQRLRGTDFIGRYGGEEFAVIMPDTAPEDAARVLDGIRETFGGIRHFAAGQVFRVSFSAGIAAAPPAREALGLAGQADAALYAAKRGGRDRVQLAAS